VVHAQTLDLVQWDKNSGQEQFVFLLEGQRETVDDTAQNLEQLSDTVESLCLVDELEEDIVNRSSDV
jgi:hypothetical protein